MPIRRVTTIQEAIESLDFFNYFHDGFIKRLTVLSQDEFIDRGEQRCSGELQLEITFAHYNYQRDERPHSQTVEARFESVKDLSITFSGNSHEWAINSLTIGETIRASEFGGEESCLKAALTQSRLKDGREWVLHEDLSFTFRSCTFNEVETV